MEPLARRGKRLFLILATLFTIAQVAGVILALTKGGGEIRWFKSVLLPLAQIVSFAFMWQGDIWLRRLVEIWQMMSGALEVYVGAKIYMTLRGVTPPENPQLLNETFGFPLAMLVAFGFFWVLAGVFLLFSPSLSAFFSYQRDRFGTS